MNKDRQLPVDNPSPFVDDLSNGALKRRLQQQHNDAVGYWDGGNKAKRNLSSARKRNYNWWIGNHYEDIDLYEHDVKYINNRIYRSVEASIRIAVARVAYATILPGNEKDTTIQFSLDLEKSLQRIAEKRKLKKKMQAVARNLLTKYVGVLEPVFDGTINDIDFRVVDPEDITISPYSNMFEEPEYYDVKRHGTAKQIAKRFPAQEAAIRQYYSLQQDELFDNDIKQRTYMEVWYDDFVMNEETGEEDLVVRAAFFLETGFNLLLGIIDNPHWLPEDDPTERHNYFEKQRKPMIFINYQNSGETKIDDNAAIDQQIPLNRIVNKRGRQMTENADDASGGIIYNTRQISKDDMSMLIGAPDEKIGVDGDVNQAFARVVPPILPAYVQNDMIDARNQIDELGATTPTTINGRNTSATLGQATLQKQDDYQMQTGLSDAAEDGYLQGFEWCLQLMKVWYTQEKMIQIRGEDGQFDYAMISSDKIEDGTDVQIVTGSSAPLNKERNQQTVQQWAQWGVIDPLSLYEVNQTGELPSPARMVQRLVDWKTNPSALAGTAKKEEYDRNAQVDIELIKRGVEPNERPEITADYLDTLIEFVTSGTFLTLDPTIQKAMQIWLEHCKNTAAKLLQLREGLRTDASQTLAPNQPIAIDPRNTDPTQTPPPGQAPPEMLAQLQAQGAVDGQGRPTVAPTGQPVMPQGGAPVTQPQVPTQ